MLKSFFVILTSLASTNLSGPSLRNKIKARETKAMEKLAVANQLLIVHNAVSQMVSHVIVYLRIKYHRKKLEKLIEFKKVESKTASKSMKDAVSELLLCASVMDELRN